MTDHYRWHLSLQWVPPDPRLHPTWLIGAFFQRFHALWGRLAGGGGFPQPPGG